MDAIGMLKEQHGDVAEMFEQLDEVEGEEKQELFNHLADALAIHAAIEEAHFYPAVRASRTEDILLESLEEHLAIKRVLADLLDLDFDDAVFDAKLKVLQEEVEHHVEEEEGELFPKVSRLFGKERLAEIGAVMQQMADELEGTDPRFQVRHQTGEAAPLT
jgi:hypothetical protein